MSHKYVLGPACVLALALVVRAQNSPATLPVNPYPVPLYRMTDVSKTLNLTPEQVTRLNTLTDQTQARFKANYSALSAVAEAERAARVRELNRQYYADWYKGARDVFDEAQRTRYQQLTYQYGGFDTLYDPDVQTRLALTPAQTKTLADQVNWNERQLQDINRLAATDAAKAAQAYRDYWTQRQERFNTYLTPQQQKVWSQMIGQPYTFQPNFPPRR